MDPSTGEHRQLPPGMSVPAGEKLADHREEFERLAAQIDDLDAKRDADRLRELLDDGAPLVAVSDDVVQRLRLGDRELGRRRQRRR